MHEEEEAPANAGGTAEARPPAATAVPSARAEPAAQSADFAAAGAPPGTGPEASPAAGLAKPPAEPTPAEPTLAEPTLAEPTLAEPTLAETAAALAERFPALFAPGEPRPIKLRIQADIQQRAPGVFTKKQLSIFLHRHTTSTAYIRALVAATQRFDLDGAAAGDVAAEHLEAARAELERRRQIVQQRRAGARAQALAAAAGGPPDARPGAAAGAALRPQQAAGADREHERGRGRGREYQREQRPGPRPPQSARPERPPRPGRASGAEHGRRDGREARPRPRPGQPAQSGQPERPIAHPAPAEPALPAAPLTPADLERRERAMLLRSFEGSPLTATNFCALKGLPLGEFEAQIALARREREERQRGGRGQ